MTAADLATPTRVGARKSGFYLWTGVAVMAVAVIGFAPTFWIPLAQGVPERFPLPAVHGMLCYAWIAFLIYQAWLVRSGQVARHRDAGLIGVSLATALVLFGIMATVGGARRGIAAGYADGNEAFMIVPMGELICFTAFLVAALLNLKRLEWHKRFMIAATGAILPAAIARLVIAFVQFGGHLPLNGTVGVAGLPPGPPAPVTMGLIPTLMPDLLAMELFVVSGMIHDWRIRGRVHPAYWWAGGFNLAFELMKPAIGTSALWHHIARGLLAVF